MASRESRKEEMGECLATDCNQLYELGSLDHRPDVHNGAIQEREMIDRMPSGNAEMDEEENVTQHEVFEIEVEEEVEEYAAHTGIGFEG